MTSRRPSPVDVLLLAVIAGVLATVLGGYAYATSDQVEQLPMILRAMDSDYLSEDLAVSAGSPVRAGYVALVAFLARFAPLPSVVFALSLLTNIAIAMVTGLCARDLFGRSSQAGLVAIVITMSVTTFVLGTSGTVYRTQLSPNGLALPLGFLSVWAALRGYPLLCVAPAVLASVIHPTFGLMVGGIGFVVLALAGLFASREQQLRERRLYLLRVVVAALVLGGAIAVWAMQYLSMEHLGSDRLTDIFVHFRSPHHLAPSNFRLREWVEGLGFLVATGIGWYWWRQNVHASRRLVASIPIFISIILLLCLGGYVFVELIPSPFWIAAQPYRLLFLVKWLGLTLAGGTVATFLAEPKDTEDRFDGWLLLAGTLSPLTMGLTHVLKLVRARAQQHLPVIGAYLGFGSTLLVTTAALIVLVPGQRQLLRFLVLALMFLTLVSPAKRYRSRLTVLAIAASLLLLILLGRGYFPPGIDTALDKIRPAISPEDLTGDEVTVARWARDNSPVDGLFLAPPEFGQFRITAERALLVDFKLFPGHLADEWQQRLFDSYGVPRGTGFGAAQEMDEMYRQIDDARLRSLQAKYGIEYAVLYVETDTSRPVVYENGTYKVVELTDPPEQPLTAIIIAGRAQAIASSLVRRAPSHRQGWPWPMLGNCDYTCYLQILSRSLAQPLRT